MTDAQLDLLNGHILATQFALREIILMQANPREASRRVASAMELVVAKGLASATTNEPQLAAFESAKKAILPTEKDLLRAHPGGH